MHTWTPRGAKHCKRWKAAIRLLSLLLKSSLKTGEVADFSPLINAINVCLWTEVKCRWGDHLNARPRAHRGNALTFLLIYNRFVQIKGCRAIIGPADVQDGWFVIVTFGPGLSRETRQLGKLEVSIFHIAFPHTNPKIRSLRHIPAVASAYELHCAVTCFSY